MTSTLRSVAEIALPASRDRASMRYVEAYVQRYNPPGAWPESSGALAMAQLWDWTPRPTSTHLLHDVRAKPAVMSTPVNDQVLIYTPESREAIVCKFLA